MKIGIIGYGYVGQAMTRFFSVKYDIEIYDPAYSKKLYAFSTCNDHNGLHQINNSSLDIISRECELIVICVPTPMQADKNCDISLVEESIKELCGNDVLIKSTIRPGTTDYLQEKYSCDIAFSPEYIGEGGYNIPDHYPHPTDMAKRSFHIFGGRKHLTEKLIDIFVPITGPNPIFYQTTAKIAEVIKYMENMWLGTKVIFANEMYSICKALGINYWETREGWALDGRMEKSHTAVFKKKRGFGGKCLPKDINALIKSSEENGYIPEFFKEVLKSNDKFLKINENYK